MFYSMRSTAHVIILCYNIIYIIVLCCACVCRYKQLQEDGDEDDAELVDKVCTYIRQYEAGKE